MLQKDHKQVYTMEIEDRRSRSILVHPNVNSGGLAIPVEKYRV
jgi:hypothetical protein